MKSNNQGEELEDQPIAGLAALKEITPPASLLPAVMQRISEPPPVTFWTWLLRPRRLELRLSPVGALATLGAVGVALFALLSGTDDGRRPVLTGAPAPAAPRAGQTSGEPETVLVRFVLAAKGARKVAVAGDFNGWNAAETVLVDADGQGTFVATVPLRRGAYEYMFLVDGEWKTDPGASETRPDGFGRANGVLRL